MKICICGAGTLAGYLGVRLSQAGAEVNLLARGTELTSLNDDGVKLITGSREEVIFLPATDQPAELGPQDYVIVAAPAARLPMAAAALRPLLGAETAVVTAAADIPYWYFYGQGGDGDAQRVGGELWQALGPERAIGCVIDAVLEPAGGGAIRHLQGNTAKLGEPAGAGSARVQRLAELLEPAELRASIVPDIRCEIWKQLCAALGAGPRREVRALAAQIGVALPATRSRATSTSDIDAAAASVRDLANLVGMATPSLDKLLASRAWLKVERRAPAPMAQAAVAAE